MGSLYCNGLEVYCNKKDCIAGWFGWGGRLCHDTNIVS